MAEIKRGMKKGAKQGENKLKLLLFLQVHDPKIYNDIIKSAPKKTK